MAREYSVVEIDRMRAAVEHRWLYGRKISEPDPNARSWTDGAGTFCTGSSTISRPYRETEMTECVESLLRTYMLAGTEPADLE